MEIDSEHYVFSVDYYNYACIKVFLLCDCIINWSQQQKYIRSIM